MGGWFDFCSHEDFYLHFAAHSNWTSVFYPTCIRYKHNRIFIRFSSIYRRYALAGIYAILQCYASAQRVVSDLGAPWWKVGPWKPHMSIFVCVGCSTVLLKWSTGTDMREGEQAHVVFLLCEWLKEILPIVTGVMEDARFTQEVRTVGRVHLTYRCLIVCIC